MSPGRKPSDIDDDDHEPLTRADFEDRDDPENVSERYDGSTYRDPGTLSWIGPDE